MKRLITTLVPLAVYSLVLSACAGSGSESLVDEVEGLRSDVAALSDQVAELDSTLTETTAPSNQASPTTTSPPETTTTTTTATTTSSTTAPGADMATLAVEFFVASETLCVTHASLTGNPAPDPGRYVGAEVVEVLDSDRVLIRDGLDYELVVDFSTDTVTIYSSEGPDGILPFDLSFGCPPELYLGTLPS